MASSPKTNDRDRGYLSNACSFLDQQQDSPGSPSLQQSPVSPLLFELPTEDNFLTPQPAQQTEPPILLLTPQHVSQSPTAGFLQSPVPPVPSIDELLKQLPTIGQLRNTQRLQSFVQHNVLREAARKLWDLQQEHPSVNIDAVCSRWCSLVVEAISQIVPPFGLEGAGHLTEVAKRLLSGWTLSMPEVSMLQLALSTSSAEMCAELVRIATERSQASVPMMDITESNIHYAAMHSAQAQQPNPTMHSAQTQLQSPDIGDSFDFLSGMLDDEDETRLPLQTEAVPEKRGNQRHRKDGNIRGPNGTLSLTPRVSQLWQGFVDDYEKQIRSKIGSRERSRLRSWLYKSMMRIGGEAVLRNGVHIGVCSMNKLLLEADRWEAEPPSDKLCEESKQVYHLRPILLRFLASQCSAPEFELIVAQDNNIIG